jgi:hypothetical protein
MQGRGDERNCSMGRYCVCCGTLSVFPQAQFHVRCVASGATECENFNSKSFVFLWNIGYCLNAILLLKSTITSSIVKSSEGL